MVGLVSLDLWRGRGKPQVSPSCQHLICLLDEGKPIPDEPHRNLGSDFLMMTAPAARADYAFQFVQFDDAGEDIEHGKWPCSDIQMQEKHCTQGIMLVVDDRPRPVELQFQDDGGILRISSAFGGRLLEARSVQPLYFDHDRVVATVVTWETGRRAEPDGLKIDDLVVRGSTRLFATFNLIVTRTCQK